MRKNMKNVDKLIEGRLKKGDIEHEEVLDEYADKILFNGFNYDTDLFVFLRKKEYSILNDITWETSNDIKNEIVRRIKNLPSELFY